MTAPYILELFELFDKEQKDLLTTTNFIGKIYENKDNIIKLFKNAENNVEFDKNIIKINDKEYNNDDDMEELDILFNYKYDKPDQDNNNKYYKFAYLIQEIKKIIEKETNFFEYNEKSLTEYENIINKCIEKTNYLILKKIKEINNSLKTIKDDKLTKLQISQIFNKNKEKFKPEIIDFIREIDDYIESYKKDYDKKINEINIDDVDVDPKFNKEKIKNFLNNYYNIFFKNFKKYLQEALKKKENENIKTLLDFFKDIKKISYADLKDADEDLTQKYKLFVEKIFNVADNFKDIKLLLKFQELFDTNSGEWKNDSKKDEKIKEYKKIYDQLLVKLKPENIEVNKQFVDLYNYSEKIKEIKEKLEKKEKLQKSERDFIIKFEEYMNVIKNNPDFSSNPEYNEQVENIEKIYKEFNIKKKVETEIEQKRIVENVISKEEKERNDENVYFDDYISLFKITLKFFAYGGILLSFVVLFLSVIGLIILFYDMIYNTIKLLVNSANSTNNISLDYISKSIIKCSKDNYNNDRFFILTEQKQNLSIFNIGAYTIYMLIFYFAVYFSFVFYSNQMRFKFVGSIYDIDNNFIYLFMIAVLLFYSFIHLILFKNIFKPFVYIPYKTIDEEENSIDNLIASYIIVKTDKNGIIRFDDFFDLLYDASKIDELNEYILKQIKNEDTEGCLEQKIIIYNIYEYLRQYIIFDEDFKWNFKQYCSTIEKPKYENGDTITFISMLKNNEVNIISNYHEELDFIKNLEDNNIEFYNKLNLQISNKIKNINKKIITHNKTTLPFFITIVYIILIFLLNLFFIYIIVQMILSDKTDAYHIYIIYVSKYLNDYIFETIKKIFYK